MLSNLKNKLLKNTTIVVIGIHFEAESETYNVIKVSQKNNKLSISEQSSFNSFDQLNKALEKKSSIVLNFSGKGILNKRIANTPDYKSKALLNVDNNDFYFYEHLQEKEVFISVIRKKKVHKFIEMFNDTNFFIVDYSIGPFIASILSSIEKKDQIISNDIELIIVENRLYNFKKTNEKKTITIDNQTLSERETALLAGAINYFRPISHFNYESGFLQKNKEEVSFKKYFETLGITILSIFFSLLLLSYFLLNFYNKKIYTLSSNIESVQETYNIVKNLQKDRDNKKEILNESGVFTSRFLAFYINQLTIDIPKSITLNTFSLFPYDRKIKPSEKIKFEENVISIKGESSSNTLFNNWYKNLKKIDWITKSDIITYTANRNSNYDFEIKINIK
ncbi:PilN domain-containing protein [Lacinutrix chionoecetis]